jgi:hypothetical protein
VQLRLRLRLNVGGRRWPLAAAGWLRFGVQKKERFPHMNFIGKIASTWKLLHKGISTTS